MGLRKGQTPKNFLEMRQKGWAASKGRAPWNKGLTGVLSPATLKKLSDAKKGLPPPFLGKHHSEETKRKISLAKKGQRNSISTEFKKGQFAGDKHPNWRGGINSERSQQMNSPEYAEWRQAVFSRDNYTCQSCKQRGGTLHADHELPYSLFPSLRYEVLNGRTLCAECHYKTYNNLRALKRVHMMYELQ